MFHICAKQTKEYGRKGEKTYKMTDKKQESFSFCHHFITLVTKSRKDICGELRIDR